MDLSSEFTESNTLGDNQSKILRLKRIEVEKLFGIYDHRIDLNLDHHVTLLHGPNGVGKTVILRMINAILDGHLSHFRIIPFLRFAIEFHDGSTVELTKPEESADEAHLKLESATDDEPNASRIRLSSEAEHVAGHLSFLKPHDAIANVWVDTRDDEHLTADEVVLRYRDKVPREDFRDIPWYNSFLRKVNSYLIQEQRLLKVAQNERSRQLRFWPRERTDFVSTVIEYSQEFQRRLAREMADYGRQSQTLDQSFPQRLISPQLAFPVNQLQTRMTELEHKTAELKHIGVLDETPAIPFRAETLDSIDSSQVRAMTERIMMLYVSDMEKKLAVIDDLATRSRLLLKNVNQKYQHKHIRLDLERGLLAEGENEESLALDALSSGEQHELVLHYELLFRVPSNTIVLIDEPELSLHVAWQKGFLAELLEIIGISGFDALIATHSPYIIGDRHDLMVGLGSSE